MLLVWFLALAPCLLVLCNVDFAADRQALLDLYQATNGPSWERRGNWTTAVSMCHWHGVSCACSNDVCRVQELLLPSNDMNGTLPVSIGSLSELVTLNLNTNMLSGDVPTSIGQLIRLKYLDLGVCIREQY
jgi:Leucine-rich repeat (LRR) protein